MTGERDPDVTIGDQATRDYIRGSTRSADDYLQEALRRSTPNTSPTNPTTEDEENFWQRFGRNLGGLGATIPGLGGGAIGAAAGSAAGAEARDTLTEWLPRISAVALGGCLIVAGLFLSQSSKIQTIISNTVKGT